MNSRRLRAVGQARHFASSNIKLGPEIEIPVKLFSCLSEERGASLRKLHAHCGHALEQRMWCPQCSAIVEEDDQAKGYEVAPKRYLMLSKEEIAEIFDHGEPEVAGHGFLPANAIDPLLFERSYYLSPHEGGDRGYQLLARVLGKKTALFGRSTIRGREHLAEIVSEEDRLILRQIAHGNRLRPIDDVPRALSTLSQPEIRLGHMLVERMWLDSLDLLSFEDQAAARVAQLLSEKALGRPVPISEKRAPIGQPILDLAEALQRSLALSAKTLRR